MTTRDVCVLCVSLARKPGRMHTNGNLPSVRASVGLAAQGSNVSFGSGLSPNCFSLFIHEIKKCILNASGILFIS